MGITNFCKFLEPILPPTPEPEFFDSILVDVQSYLYIAIELALQSDESKFMNEVCHITWSQLSKNITALLNYASAPCITLVLSFDGHGVPMKWPTQRKRRTKNNNVQGKNLYRYALFGVNTISTQVERYIIQQLKVYRFPSTRQLNVVLCGCNVAGEGEHKIFQVAETLSCRHALVVSVDQDVFVLAFMRVERYDTIQIYRYNKFYNVTRLLKHVLPYPASRLIITTFLFGNDFIPTLVGITLVNPPTIHASLHFDTSSSDESSSSSDETYMESNPAHVMATFLNNIASKIRFERVSYVDSDLMIAFWTTYLWCVDYYTQRDFAQKYLVNPIFDIYDRNQLLTGLSKSSYSALKLQEAQALYTSVVTRPTDACEAVRAVFTDEEMRQKLEPYWIQQADASCFRLRLTKRIPTTTSKRYPTIEI